MARIARWVLLPLLAVLLMLAAAMWLVESPWAREWLEKQASQRLGGRNVEVGALDIGWGWPLAVCLEDVRIANPDWAPHERLLTLQALEFVVDTNALLKGDIQLGRLHLQRPAVHLARREDGATSWEGLMDQEDDGEPGMRPDAIRVAEGRLTYRDPLLDAALDVAFHTREDESHQLVAEAEGSLQGQSVQLDARGDAPAEALASDPLAYAAQFQGRLGESRLSGSVGVVWEETLHIETQLNVDRLDLARWGLGGEGGAEMPADEREQAERAVEQAVEQAGEAMAWDRRWAERLATLRAFEATVDLAIGQLSYGDHTLHDVALDARLAEGRLDVARLHAAQDGGALTLQGWLAVHAETLSGDVDARLTAIDLEETLGPLGFDDLGTLDGRLQARFDDGALTLDDTSLDYRVPALALALHVDADAADLAGTAETGVHLQGEGRYRDEPFAFDLRVGPLLDLDDPDTPYPVQGQVSSRDSLLQVDGTIEQPLAISAVQGSVELSGPNPARLNRLTGLNLPALPPYSLQGELQVRDDLVRLNDLTGRVGNSDASGDVRLRLGEHDMLWATLHSQQLDLDDLAPLIGAAPETGEGEVASAEQQRQAREEERQPGVFPDRRWNVQGLRRMDAELHYSAASVSAEDIPLTDVQFDLSLEDGVLTLAPLRVGLGGGEATARVRMAALEDALQGDLELSLRQVDLKALLQRADLAEIAEDSAGTLGGEGKVSFVGDSLAAAMANLDGSLTLAMSGGQLHMLVLEGMGLDAGEALLGALADSQEVPMRCAFARLSAEDGMTTLEQLFIDTEDSNITGTGTIDLASEQVALVFEAHAKDFSVLASDSPVKLQGPLDDLGVDVVSRELVARGLLSVLGALVAPPLAILPWIEPGTGENVGPGCRQVMAEFAAEESGG